MDRRPRLLVAAAAAVLAVALAIPAGDARSSRHPRAASQPAAPTAPLPENPAGPPGPTGAQPSGQQSQLGKAGTLAIVFDSHDVEAVLGKLVRSSTGEDMGRLVDAVVDHDGLPRAAIIDFGGFLGVGSRKIAVDWGALDFARGAEKGVITVQLTRDQVKAAPEFKEGSPVVVLGTSGGSQPPAAPPPQPAPTTSGQSIPTPPQAREK